MAVREIGVALLRAMTRVGGGQVVGGAVLTALAIVVLVLGSSAQAVAGSSGGTSGSSGTANGSSENGSPPLRGSRLVPAGSLAGQVASEGSQSVESGQAAAAAAALQARRDTPAAKAARVASRTRFEHLTAARAAQVAREAFPEAIDDPVGGPPRLPAGTHITHYIGDNTAQLALPGGKHAVIESMQPIALETSRGQRAPVDLGLTKTGGAFESVRPVVGVVIPRRLSAGVQLPEAGVSLTPVDSTGSPLGGSGGALDGASVLYANTQTDTDTTIKPTTGGVEANTILRSVDSPEQLYFRVGLPPGASLVQAQGGAGPVQVINDGQAIALVRPPNAVDATGASVPVSMSVVRGDLLALSVSARGGEYQWPVAVDPEVKDKFLGRAECHKKGEAERISSNWCVYSGKTGEAGEDPSEEEGPSRFKHRWSSGALSQSNAESIPSAGEYTVAVYHTQGQSKIFKIQMETAGSVRKGRAKLELAREVTENNNEGGQVEHSELIAEATGESTDSWGLHESHVCAEPSSCTYTAGAQGNIAAFKLEADEPGAWMSATQENTIVYIYQEKGPETSPSSACSGCGFNTTSPEVDEVQGKKRTNVLYGPGAWLGPYSGALEVTSHDPGIGISREFVQGSGFRVEAPIYEAGKCNGYQCNETYSTAITYMGEGGNPEDEYEHMAEGDDSFELLAEDEAGLWSYSEHTVKVDATPPHALEVSGWSKNREISATSHVLTVEATDGEKPTPSSGVRSISVSIDGGPETAVPGAACPEGPCTASGKYTLDAEGLSEGVHRLIVTATDNANNVAAREWTFDVRHGSPVTVGPGTVDPTTGQFKLSATDVSLAGVGGVSRAYQSRNLTAGVGGPLGPQWTLGLGGGEGLTVLPNGSVVLASSSGATTTFARNEKGEFESPLGDGNVKIEPKEEKAGKGITEYLLKETTAGTTTTFVQPVGTENTLPVYSNQFGAEGVQLNKPISAAIDSSGNVWVADNQNGRIVKFSSAGTVLAAYGAQGSSQGQLNEPRGIAINQSSGNVYIADEGNNRIVELKASGEFIRTFGWDVDPGATGKEEFQICTEYCKAGTAGSGNGQFREVKGLAIDSSGNVWVADYGNNRIEELKENGEYVQRFGTSGSGEMQFSGPSGIAFSGGNLYVSEYGNDRVQEISTAGKYLSQFGKSGSGSSGSGSGAEFKEPRGIAADPKTGDLYVADTGNNRVQEFTSAGKLIAKIGTAGSGAGQLSEPKGVAIGFSGGVYVTDGNNNRIEEWTRPTWLPIRAESPLASTTNYYAYKPVEVEGKTVIEPSEVVAPAPSKVTCMKEGEKVVGEALTKGCRALILNYASKTKSPIGEGPSEWGEYVGHLSSVAFKAYNPAKGAEKMEEKSVAEYAYDSKGRLRAEWDPRISTPLKTTYGYDEEGHVTSVSPPGQEPWLMHYGALTGDPNTGRLLSVTRPAASSKTVLKEQEAMAAPVNTSVPTLSSTSPTIGTTLKASSEGKWNNSPLTYGYQWKDCYINAKSESVCTAIPGAVNQSYTPQASDGGYQLVVQVKAENGDGATVKASAETKAVPMAPLSYSSKLGASGSENEKLKGPLGLAFGREGNIWVADYGKNRVAKFSPTGSFIAAYSPDAMLEPVSIAVSPTNGNVYVTNRGHNRIDELSPEGSLLRVFGGEGSGAGQLNYPSELTIDAEGNVWVVDRNNSRVVEFSSSGSYLGGFGSAGTGEGQFKSPSGVTECAGNLYVADSGNNRIQEFSRGGQYIGQFGSAGTGNGQFNEPLAIECESANDDLYVSDTNNKRVEEFNTAGVFLSSYTGSGETQLVTPIGMAVGTKGTLYVGDAGSNWIEKLVPTYSTNNPTPEPPTLGTASVSTIEYHVPLSGTGLQNLTSGEVVKWGQKDDPTEAMAIFPPDKPMGWPATEYKRATVNYMDEQGRTVDVASPSGGVSTTEYNEANDVVRTLSADNRAAALNETGKTAEAAELLDTKSKYNGETTAEREQEEKEAIEKGKPSDPYSKLLETLGPEHKVLLAHGSSKSNEEAKAREQVKYFYDEGSPEGKTYNLATKTVDAAEVGGKEYDKRTTATSYSGAGTCGEGHEVSGWTLRKPTSVTKEPGGLNLTTKTVYEPCTGNVVETQAPGGSGSSPGVAYASQFGSRGTGNGQFESPLGIVLDGKGDLLVADKENARVDVLKENGEFVKSFGTSGTGLGQFGEIKGVAVDSKGNIWTIDQSNDRLQVFNEKGEAPKVFGSVGTEGGKFKEPKGIAVDSHNNVWVADTGNNRVEEFNEKGEFLAALGFDVNEGGKEAFEVCTSKCKAGTAGAGKGQFNAPKELTVDGAGNVWVTDTSNHRVEEFNEKREFVKTFGEWGTGNGQFNEPKGIAIDAQHNIWVTDAVNNRVEEFNEKGEYLAQVGSSGTGNGQFEEPWGIQVNAHGEVFVSDVGNNRIQKFTTASSEGNAGAHDIKTAYYTPGTESPVSTCQNHPEWANLACQTEPAAQTGVGGSPELPVTTLAYNMWDEIVSTSEKFGTGAGAVTRTKAQTYDPAGRALTSEEIAKNEKSEPVDTTLPGVTNEYNSETGALEKQNATIGGKVRTITSVDNTLGELESYTDASGSTSKYVYGGTATDGQLEEMSYEIAKTKYFQIYAYSPTTMQLEKLLDSAAKTFTATYDVEGKMLTEGYPNGMTAKYAYNPLGTATGIEYVKNVDCASKCPETWFSDADVPSIHGETLAQTSTLAKEAYAYDSDGRLTEAQETPTGKGCRSRLYAYNEESDRTSQTTRESSTETCASEGGTVQTHAYDSAGRLMDSGVKYETLGNTTNLPAADAEGHEIASSYYVDGQVAGQTQNEKTIGYTYDPAGRAMETEAIVKAKHEPIVTSHYSGSGEALTWTSEEAEKTWTRNIPGIDGALDAIETSGGTTTLQLHDLQGNIVGKVGIGEAEAKLSETYNSTEFGVPNEGKAPPKYGWLGADGVSTELSSGVSNQGGASYVPQVARDLQTEQVVPPGAFPDGQGTGEQYGSEIPGWYISLSNAESAATIAEYTAKQEALKRKREEEEAAAGGGDPCVATYLQEEEEIKNLYMAAWVTVQWCYSNGKVLSAKLKNHGHHEHGRGSLNPLGIHFHGWEEHAHWVRQGTSSEAYWIQQVAVFWITAADVTEIVSGLPVPHLEEYCMDFEYELFGSGEVSATEAAFCPAY